jgi:site-specific recombinase XerD
MNSAILAMIGRRLAFVPFVMKRDNTIGRLRHAARQKRERIQQNATLSESQRRAALEMLSRQTEEEMRRALGAREFNAFKAFHHWWFRELCA